jgi:hypothetical protein
MESLPDLSASWLSNYEDFYQAETSTSPDFLADCRIHVLSVADSPPSDVIIAHQVLLSNSSDFFYNTFTAGMRETETGVVEVICKPPTLFRSIVRWMYSGKFEFNPDDIVNLIQVTHEYGIQALEGFLSNELQTVVTAQNLLHFLDKCFEYQLPDAIQHLEPFLIKFLREIDPKELGRVCDVATFVKVLMACELGNKEKINIITKFVDADTGYELTSDDRMRLTQCLNRAEPLKELLSPDLKWLRRGFYQQLKG